MKKLAKVFAVLAAMVLSCSFMACVSSDDDDDVPAGNTTVIKEKSEYPIAFETDKYRIELTDASNGTAEEKKRNPCHRGKNAFNLYGKRRKDFYKMRSNRGNKPT